MIWFCVFLYFWAGVSNYAWMLESDEVSSFPITERIEMFFFMVLVWPTVPFISLAGKKL